MVNKSKKAKLERKIAEKPKGPPKFNVPETIIEQVFEEIKRPNALESIQRQIYDNHVSLVAKQQCHYDKKEIYSVWSKDGLKRVANYQIAAKQALEMRDFKAVYQICIKGLELKNTKLNRILYEYLYIAIENDPVISPHQRESFMMEAVRGCKIMYVKKGSAPFEFPSEKAALKHIQESHKLLKRDDRDDESDDEEIKIEKECSDNENEIKIEQ